MICRLTLPVCTWTCARNNGKGYHPFRKIISSFLRRAGHTSRTTEPRASTGRLSPHQRSWLTRGLWLRAPAVVEIERRRITLADTQKPEYSDESLHDSRDNQLCR